MTTRMIEVPLNKLTPSSANVRKTGRLNGLESLAANIEANGGKLIQSLAVSPIVDGEGAETGRYRVTGGGRRLAALKLLAKRKVITKSEPVPCLVAEGDEAEVSLAENVMREALHPADQFEAFKRLADRGLGEEEIAARFGVTAQVVKQRLRLAAVSPQLMQVYRDEGLTLEQLMAFAVTEDHARQMQVFEALSWNKEPYTIRRLLTESKVSARDRRAAFVGAEAYVEAGGVILRDLFTEDGGGWFEDAALLDRLAVEKLEAEAERVRAEEGWAWAKAALDCPVMHGMGRVYPEFRALSEEDQTRLEALQAEFDQADGEAEADEAEDDTLNARLDDLAQQIRALTQAQQAYADDVFARAGILVTLSHMGEPRIERGLLRADDVSETLTEDDGGSAGASTDGGGSTPPVPAGPKPLADSVVFDLAAHKTAAMRLRLAEQSDIALTALVHALALRLFYHGYGLTMLDLTPVSASLRGHSAPACADAMALNEQVEAWRARLPEDARDLWTAISGLDGDTLHSLLALCAGLTLDAFTTLGRAQGTGADLLCEALGINMAERWRPTATGYFGRLTKGQILADVREAVSEDAARQIDGMKKDAMADAAEQLVSPTTWLPIVLRGPATQTVV